MPSLRQAAAAVAVLGASTTVVTNAHQSCYTANRLTLDADLAFCEVDVDGACCDTTQEAEVIDLFNVHGDLTDTCADLYKQVGGAGSLFEIILLWCLLLYVCAVQQGVEVSPARIFC